MRKTKKIISNPIFSVVVFVLGIAFGTVGNWCGLSFRTNIDFNLFDVISMAVTVALALYIASVIETDIQKSQVGKSIWVNRFETIETLCNKLSDNLLQKDIDYTIVVNINHHLRSKLTHIKELLKEHNIGLENDKDFILLMKNIKKLKDLLTNTPIDKKDISKIEMRNGIVNYSSARIKEIQRLINQIDNNIFQMKLKMAYS